MRKKSEKELHFGKKKKKYNVWYEHVSIKKNYIQQQERIA